MNGIATVEAPSRVPAGPLGFGKHMTDYISVCRYSATSGWEKPRIAPYGTFQLDPCALVLHYGQAIYEGMKAYRRADGSVALFRPDRNAARFRASAARMAMAEMSEEFFVRAAKDLVAHERAWVPDRPDSSLYLRPVMIGDEAAFGMRRSSTYLFFIVATPVDALYRSGSMPMRLLVTEEYARAAPGGGGDAKTAGNYGRTLVALDDARAKGFDNVLWLDPVGRENIEEAGITNVFVRKGNRVLTPPLNGRILAGVTRETVIEQLRNWGLRLDEREISIGDLTSGIADSVVDEVFLTGTATHIAPVGCICWRGKDYAIDGGASTSSLAARLSKAIGDVQKGLVPDPKGWMVAVE